MLVSPSGTVSGKVLELESGDEFLPLNVGALRNESVQEVREGYAALLSQIAQSCFTPLLFLNAQSNRMADAIRERYGDTPDFPWKRFPGYGVFRHAKTRKWYGLVLHLPPARLYQNAPAQKARLPQKLAAKPEVEILNLKLPPEEIPRLTTEPGIFPGYHLNAMHWISVLLEDVLPDTRILELIARSHALTLPRPRTSERPGRAAAN